MTPAQRKSAQRQRDRLLGWSEITLKVSAEHVAHLREYAASLTPPPPLTDERQLSLLEQLDAQISGRDMSPPEILREHEAAKVVACSRASFGDPSA